MKGFANPIEVYKLLKRGDHAAAKIAATSLGAHCYVPTFSYYYIVPFDFTIKPAQPFLSKI